MANTQNSTDSEMFNKTVTTKEGSTTCCSLIDGETTDEVITNVLVGNNNKNNNNDHNDDDDDVNDGGGEGEQYCDSNRNCFSQRNTSASTPITLNMGGKESKIPTTLTTTSIDNGMGDNEDKIAPDKENVEPNIKPMEIEVNECSESNRGIAATTVASTMETIEKNETDQSSTAFCPMTIRRVVDTDDTLKTTDATALRRKQINPNSEGNGETQFYDDEDEMLVQFLGEASHIAEARLAARRLARAEAREIRMKELERQQKEQEQNADRAFDMHGGSSGGNNDPLIRSRLTTAGIMTNALLTTRGGSMSSRRSSEDSLEEEGRSLRDIRHELKDVEERFRKAMIANAQLDNERASQTYQIQLLKDKLEEMEETYAQLQREHKEKTRDCNALKRNLDKLSEELKLVQGQLNERDTLIGEQGLVIVAVENEDGSDAKRALVSVENAQFLGSVQGSLDVRIKKFAEEKQQLLCEVQKLQDELDNCKNSGKGGRTGGSAGGVNFTNGPSETDEDYDAQREANKIISDFKYRLQKAEQEIASLQASLARSETQVIRYKSTAEAAEKAEAELKVERRKLQRENREAMERLEELETSNNHLLKRLDKLKNAKSALLKDL